MKKDHFAANDANRSVQREDASEQISKRHTIGSIWRIIFQTSTIIGIFFLSLLLLDIVNESFGYVALEFKKSPNELTPNNIPLEELSKEEFVKILQENLSKGRFRQLGREKPFEDRSWEEIYQIVISEVLEPTVLETWGLIDSLLHKKEIYTDISSQYPEAQIIFKSWLNWNFLVTPQSSKAILSGVRTAILGSLWVIVIAVSIALVIGIGAAIYLEEYARDNGLNRAIQTNINNLAGVPSIVYGMLGLAIFVRTFEKITSGSAFGFSDPVTANGRTILSAGLTMALLILPMIIINAQEAIRTVPNSIRQACFGLGATQWQTIWHHVLPNAIPGILTGTILSISRVIGETAPLIVVGASTYITFDPEGLFSKFTTLPIQIYQWTSRPQEEFRNLAAAAILFLLILLLSLNAFAIILRNRYSRRY